MGRYFLASNARLGKANNPSFFHQSYGFSLVPISGVRLYRENSSFHDSVEVALCGLLACNGVKKSQKLGPSPDVDCDASAAASVNKCRLLFTWN